MTTAGSPAGWKIPKPIYSWFGPWASGAGLGTSFLPCVSAVSKSLLFSYTMTILAKAVTPITATQYIAETVSF